MQLTNEEIAKAFAMYWSCKYTDTTVEEPEIFPVIGETLTCFERYPRAMATAQLILTPLSKISDEDAIEVAKIARLWPMSGDEAKRNSGKNLIKNLDRSGYEVSAEEWFFIYEYLKLRGYAVPLFFGVGHWANGKTAIELEIAQEK